MIIDFAVKNYRSIKERQLFTMQPEKRVKDKPEHLATIDKYKLLTSAVIYGKNASGKSNLLKAMQSLYNMVSSINRLNQNLAAYQPFLLDRTCLGKPTEFEINFIAENGKRYNYTVHFNGEKILLESLYFYPGKKPALLFKREADKPIEAGETLEKHYEYIEKTLYSNQLFLSKINTDNLGSVSPAFKFFNQHIRQGVESADEYENKVIGLLIYELINDKSGMMIKNLTNLMKYSDTGICDLSLDKEFINRFPVGTSMEDFFRRFDRNDYLEIRDVIKFKHSVYDGKLLTSNIEFKLDDESTGTKRLFILSLWFMFALLEGDVTIIDELDRSLHPELTRAIIKLFNNPRTNPKHAQLIFATHDTTLLDNTLFRQDQIWFANKDVKGESTFYALSDIQGVRNNVPYAKWYMSGGFGAVPVINDSAFKFEF